MTLQRSGEILLPMTKGVTIAGRLDEASAVEYKYSDEQVRDETGRWMTGTAHLVASYHAKDDDGKNTVTGEQIREPVKAGQPQSVEVIHFVGIGPQAKVRALEIANGFPKSAGVRASMLSGVQTGGRAEDGFRNTATIHSVGGHVNFTADRTTGALNETGARRYAQIVKGFEKQGIPVEVPTERRQYVNQFESRAEFEAALAKHMGKA